MVIEQQEQDIANLLEGQLNPDTGTKEAIKTLHPEDLEKKDRLTVLTREEVSAHARVGFLVKALKAKDLRTEFLIEGLSDKIKALKVSQDGLGRGEIGNIFKPQIMGEMMQEGAMPMPMQGGMAPRRGFFSRLMGRR